MKFVPVLAIETLLPQTQCQRCGYPSCEAYAHAISDGSADINRCPPGGPELINQLAKLLDRPKLPLDPSRGSHTPRLMARIDEQRCIGCTLCIQVCPTDAIVGGPKYMHTVIEEDCTGCELCAPPCPMDCIAFIPIEQILRFWNWPEPFSNNSCSSPA